MLVVYSKDNCPNCELAKTLFKNKEIQYKEIKIVDDSITEEDTIKRSDFIAKFIGIRNVPFVINDETGKQYKTINDILNIS